jgi:O-antigen/teichoic acid export membrane protein
MGIIIKQSVKGAIWSYLGIVIGFLNVGIIMPRFFHTSEVGLVQLFTSVSLIFAQFGTLGFNSVINRLFPVFRNRQEHHHGFVFLALVTGLFGFILCIVAFFILKPWIIASNADRSPLFVEYLWIMMPLVLLRLLFTLLDNYNKVLFDTVTSTFWMEFMHKVMNLVLILLYASGILNFSMFFYGYIISLSFPVVPVIYVLLKRGDFCLLPKMGFLNRSLFREVGWTMLFGFLNGIAGIMILNIDKVFVNQYLSLSEVGVFSVCALFATLIRVPYNSVSRIATGIIAEAWKRNDTAQIQDIYQKAALNQAIFGVLIFTGILVNLDNIFRILPSEYSGGRWVLIIYSAGILVNTILGLAGNITESSKYFKMNTLFGALVMISQFALSFWLIPRWNMIGAAVATSSTFILGGVYQALFQKFMFGISGFNMKIVAVLLIGLVSFIAGWLIPDIPVIWDIILKSGFVSVLFLGMIYFLKISDELNQIAYAGIKFLKGKIL